MPVSETDTDDVLPYLTLPYLPVSETDTDDADDEEPANVKVASVRAEWERVAKQTVRPKKVLTPEQHAAGEDDPRRLRGGASLYATPSGSHGVIECLRHSSLMNHASLRSRRALCSAGTRSRVR